ncbi:hypothetical protein PAMP_021050 [Pampus punctatissimus]
MTNQEFRTLAHTKSPKTSRRTTFQDELQAAVSARASKSKTDQYSYSDDFNEDEDDFLNELLKSRKKKSNAFKPEKSKVKINNFELSDDEDKHGRTKRVSFLKTQKTPLETTTASEPHEIEPPEPSTGGYCNNLFSSEHSTNVSQDNKQFKNNGVESNDSQTTRQNSSKLSYQTSDDTLLDLPLPLPSDRSVMDSPGPFVSESTEEKRDLSATDLKHMSSADSVNEREPPRPKPRQRTLGLSVNATEKIAEDTESQDISRPQTSSTSIPLSTDTSSNITEASSPHWTEVAHTDSRSFSKSSLNKSEQSQLLTKSTVDGSRDDFISDDSKEHERKYSTSFEELNESGDYSDHSVAQVTHVHEKSSDTRASSSNSKSSQRPQSACSRKVESKYLGNLKVLDRKVSLQESPAQAADLLRATIYQEWLKKKKEKSRENMQLKKKEEILREKRKQEEETRKEDAVVSYEAWKEKKAESLKAKVKEKQDLIRKEQRATEEREEKKQSARQVFEKWKREHDHALKEKYRKQRQVESKLQLKKQEKEEERKKNSSSAFSDWCEKKKDVVHDKVSTERKENKNKAEEEQYMQEEREKMALEMYEHWLARKELEQKRRREEKRIQAILRDSPPPPWSPPNKTIPFRK